MKILNLFAGIGGNRTLWGNDHEITAVESNQQIALVYHKRFPNDKIIIGDAYQYLLDHYDEYDFIWASPPCQTHSMANNFLHAQGIRRYPDMRLWKIILFLEQWCFYNKNKIYYLVENVHLKYEPLRKPSFILGRHYFWSNFFLPHNKFEYSKISVINCKSKTRRDNQQYYEDLCKFHSIDKELIDFLSDKKWKNHDMKGQVLRNCVNPEIGKKILDQVLKNSQSSILDFIDQKKV